jgi:DNA ligase-1
MKAFAALLDHLVYQPSRLGKLRLLRNYFAQTPDPDRGYGLAALSGTLDIPHAKPALLHQLISARTDPVLFSYSYDYVGDLAETIALLWPSNDAGAQAPRLSEIVTTLRGAPKSQAADLIAGWLDALDATGRWALLKVLTGELRIGVSARLTKAALAEWGGMALPDLEEIWHGEEPPYAAIFAWAEGRAEKPAPRQGTAFRPFMLSHAIEDRDFATLDPADFIAEWKWDGIRVQVAGSTRAPARLFARSGDDISHTFPDVVTAAAFDAVLDGELLVRGKGQDPAPFADLQQRLNRKAVSKKLLETYPAFVRVYDILFDQDEDLRGLPWTERRQRLESFMANLSGEAARRFDLSPVVEFPSWDVLTHIRSSARGAGMEGLMLKRRAAPYIAGRPRGPWFKWKRDPLTVDAVLMYAQRGQGKRSSFYSDYTFGVWRDDELVPIGKAYFGFTDAELKQLDGWIRNNTTERFGPVRAVAPGLVLEVAFDAAQRSARHKSGIALRFPRVSRIRWDKPAAEADRLETVAKLADPSSGIRAKGDSPGMIFTQNA